MKALEIRISWRYLTINDQAAPPDPGLQPIMKECGELNAPAFWKRQLRAAGSLFNLALASAGNAFF